MANQGDRTPPKTRTTQSSSSRSTSSSASGNRSITPSRLSTLFSRSASRGRGGDNHDVCSVKSEGYGNKKKQKQQQQQKWHSTNSKGSNSSNKLQNNNSKPTSTTTSATKATAAGTSSQTTRKVGGSNQSVGSTFTTATLKTTESSKTMGSLDRKLGGKRPSTTTNHNGLKVTKNGAKLIIDEGSVAEGESVYDPSSDTLSVRGGSNRMKGTNGNISQYLLKHDDGDDDDESCIQRASNSLRCDASNGDRDGDESTRMGSSGDGRTNVSLLFCANGTHGQSGQNGERGVAGTKTRRNGGDGSDAKPSQRGGDGGDLWITLTTVKQGKKRLAHVKGQSSAPLKVITENGETIAESGQQDYAVELSQLQSIDWSSRGGNGGHGGRGGDGGSGYDSGAVGGAGGQGSDGADGGDGGDVRVCFREKDAYLAMIVDATLHEDEVGNRLAGGSAGKAGINGADGFSGRKDNNENLSRSQRTKHSPRRAGKAGKAGKFSFQIIGENGETSFYKTRYDLALCGVKEKHNSKLLTADDGTTTYEFGETVLFTKVDVMNVGSMPSPQQRVMIGLKQNACKSLYTHPDEHLFLCSSIPPGEKARANIGAVRFTLALPETTSLGDDYDPVSAQGSILFEAFQVGPEKKLFKLNPTSDFLKEYTSFDSSGGVPINMAFPIENREGVLGLKAIGQMERAVIRFKLSNISGQDLGRKSSGGRRIYVEYFLIDDDRYQIKGSDVIVCNTKYDRVVSVDPSSSAKEGFKGHSIQIKKIDKEGEYEIEHTMMILPSAPVFGTGALQVSVFLQGVNDIQPDGTSTESDRVNLVQRRKHEFSCHPTFVQNEKSKVVLVTTSSTTRQQYHSWVDLLNRELGLEIETYSLVLHGHLMPWKEVKYYEKDFDSSSLKCTTLRTLLKGKLVIVLNEKFVPLPYNYKKVRCCPSEMLSNLSGFDDSTRWLIVGGDSNAVKHLSSAQINDMLPSFRKWELSSGSEKEFCIEAETDDQIIEPSSVESHESLTEFKEVVSNHLERERSSGQGTSKGLPAFSTIPIISKTKKEPTLRRGLDILVDHAADLHRWLKKNDAVRNYAIEIRPAEVTMAISGYEVGSLVVYCGHSRSDNVVSAVISEGPVSKVKIIKSRMMLFSVMSACSMDEKVAIFCRALVNRCGRDFEDNWRVVRDVVVSEFVWDASQYYDGRLHTGDIKSRSLVLKGLMSSAYLKNIIKGAKANRDLHAILRSRLSDFYARIEAVADSKDFNPWWAPLSRKHAVRLDLLEAVESLGSMWQSVLDESKVKKSRTDLDEAVREHIRKRGKIIVSTKNRWKAGLSFLHSPLNDTAYPPIPKTGSLRLLREAELNNPHENMKIKKCVPVTVDPNTAKSIFEEFSDRNVFIEYVHTKLQEERNRFLYSNASKATNQHSADFAEFSEFDVSESFLDDCTYKTSQSVL